MKARMLVVAAMSAVLAAGAVTAADSPQVTRQADMKRIGGAMGALAGMAKGEKPYDAAVVTQSLTTISEMSKVFPTLFPEGSETGDETEASPAIWQNMADFKAKAEKLGADADALLANPPADQAALGAAVGTLGPNCGGCHKVYRVDK
ncbi:c-type cytochrome [Ensifer soli]|uniref:c-type cytochrome n=1 Tax=Ciceribacter sp. sgz301302 TaxID=3342379 RepID=UPI0035BA8FD0